MLARGNPEQSEKEEDTLFEEENGKYFRSMSGAFKCRHHEVQRTKLYIPDEVKRNGTRQMRKDMIKGKEQG